MKKSRVLIPLKGKPQGESLPPVIEFISDGGLEGAGGACSEDELRIRKGATLLREVEGVDEEV